MQVVYPVARNVTATPDHCPSPGQASSVKRPDRTIGYPVERVEKSPDRGPAGGAQVDHGGWQGQAIEPAQRRQVGSGQVPGMAVVPEA